MTVKSGVVALRMAASPAGIAVWPQKISEKGMMLLSSAMTASVSQTSRRRGSVSPVARSRTSSTADAIATRARTSVSGGTPSNATRTKKKDPPQRIESVTSRDQSRRLTAFRSRSSRKRSYRPMPFDATTRFLGPRECSCGLRAGPAVIDRTYLCGSVIHPRK